VHPECVLAIRRVLTPQFVEDSIRGDHLVGVDQEQCEEGLLAKGPEVDGRARTLEFERAQDPEPHITTTRHVYSSNQQI
jgi:hypothetical protein